MTDKNEKIKAITDQLEAGVKAVFTSDKYMELLNTMSRFHKYSANNCLLIAMQCPNASYVAGFNQWKKDFQRFVKKGEHAIQILAPIQHKFMKEIELADGTTEEQEVKYLTFRAVPVFDISQTDGKELPSIVSKLTGSVDGYTDLIAKLEKLSPVPVSYEEIEGTANGYFHLVDKKIVVQSGMSQAQTLKTLIHEISHSLLHDKDNGSEKDSDRHTKEVQAESTAYTVCNFLGLDTSDYSFGYVATWSTGKDTKELQSSLEVIRKTANMIITGIEA